MKKKLLLILSMVALLVCLLSVSVLAEEVKGVHYSLNKNQKTAQVSQGNRTSTTEIIEIPSTIVYEGETYRVTSISNDAFYDNKTVKEIRILSEYITAIPVNMIANTYDGALEKIYIDFSNITSIGSAGLNPSNQTNGNGPQYNKFYYYDAKAYRENGTDVIITNPDFSNMTSIGDAAFQGANFEKLTIPAAVSVGNQMFRYSSIKELVIEGENRQSFGYYNFHNCKQLEKVVIKSRNLKTIGNDNFANCTAVKEIHMDLSMCESVSSNAFCFSNKYDGGNTTTQWYNLEGEKIVDLSSMKNFLNQSFSSSNIGSAKIIWPRAIEKYENQTFRKCNINGQPIVFNVAAGKTITIGDWSLDGNSPSMIICNEGVVGVETWCNPGTAILLADSIKITSSGFCSGGTIYCKSIADGSNTSKATVVNITGGTVNNYGVCGVIASVVTADGTVTVGEVNHTTSGVINNALCPVGKVTETTCKFCDYIAYSIDGEAVEKKEHEYTLVGSIVYENYFAKGFKTTKCECGDEQASENATENALFVWKGFSVSEQADANGCYSVTQGFYVDMEAIKAYAAIKTDFAFGVVASVGKESPISIVDGEVVADSNVIFAPISKNANGELSVVHNYFDIKVTGIDESNLSTQIAFNGYVVDGGEIYYLHAGEMSETAVGSSYNEVK